MKEAVSLLVIVVILVCGITSSRRCQRPREPQGVQARMRSEDLSAARRRYTTCAYFGALGIG
jgi:hypothetical protein